MIYLPAPFIIGVGRSGTTLLRLMLDAHPDLAIPGETHFLASLLDENNGTTKDQFIRTLVGAPTWPNLAVGEEELRSALAAEQVFSVPNAVRTFFRLYAARFGKERWGDKTPPYRTQMVGLQRLLPEAHFIHIIRDGRDAALSYRGLWFGPGDEVEAQASFWVDTIKATRAQGVQVSHYIEVKYEDLVGAPETTLRKLCDYLALRYDPQMLDYHRSASFRLAEYKSPYGPPSQRLPTDINKFLSIFERTKFIPTTIRIGRWRTEMTAAERQKYEAIAGSLLHELGYETIVS